MSDDDVDGTIRATSTRVVVDGVPCRGIVEIDVRGSASIVRSIETGQDAARFAAPDLLDLGDAPIVPAPLDLHFHGAGGIVVPPGGSARGIDDALHVAATETTWRDPRVGAPAYEWLATLPIPMRPPAEPVRHIADAAASIAADGPGGCAGLRIEGLFLNPSRAGVWPPESFRRLDVGLLNELHAASAEQGTPLRIVDIAPELDDDATVTAFIERARELDIVISLAHTDATWDQALVAIDAGATLATHLWNAMRPVSHRDPGVVAACIADARVTCELICDGVHLHHGTIALSTRSERWVVVSDASPFAGCAPGPYEWAGGTVHHDGIALRDAHGHLAGSASLAWAAREPLARAGIDDLDAALALGAGPRRVLDPTRTHGLHVGDPAWILR